MSGLTATTANPITLTAVVDRLSKIQNILHLVVSDIIHEFMGLVAGGVYKSQQIIIDNEKKDASAIMIYQKIVDMNNDYHGTMCMVYNYMFSNLARKKYDLKTYFIVYVLYTYNSSKLSPSLKYDLSIPLSSIDPAGVVTNIFMAYVAYLADNPKKVNLFLRSLPPEVIISNRALVRKDIETVMDKLFIDTYSLDIDQMVQDLKGMSFSSLSQTTSNTQIMTTAPTRAQSIFSSYSTNTDNSNNSNNSNITTEVKTGYELSGDPSNYNATLAPPRSALKRSVSFNLNV